MNRNYIHQGRKEYFRQRELHAQFLKMGEMCPIQDEKEECVVPRALIRETEE